MVLKRGLAPAQVFTRERLSSDMQWIPLFPLTVCVTVDGPPGRTPCRHRHTSRDTPGAPAGRKPDLPIDPIKQRMRGRVRSSSSRRMLPSTIKPLPGHGSP